MQNDTWKLLCLYNQSTLLIKDMNMKSKCLYSQETTEVLICVTIKARVQSLVSIDSERSDFSLVKCTTQRGMTIITLPAKE